MTLNLMTIAIRFAMIFLVTGIILIVPNVTIAQVNPGTDLAISANLSQAKETVERNIQNWSEQLDAIAKDLTDPALTDQTLEKQKDHALRVSLDAEKAQIALQPVLDKTKRLIDELSRDDSADQTAKSEIEKRYKDFTALDANIRILRARAEDLNRSALGIEQIRFQERLLTRGGSIISPGSLKPFTDELHQLSVKTATAISDRFNAFQARMRTSTIFAGLIALAVIFFALTILPRWLRKDLKKKHSARFIALRTLFIDCLIPIIVMFAIWQFLVHDRLFVGRFAGIASAIGAAILTYVFLTALARGFLNPANPDLRIAALEDADSRHIFRPMQILAFFSALASAAYWLIYALDISVASTSFLIGWLSFILSLCGLFILWRVSAIMRTDTDDDALDTKRSGPNWRWFIPFTWLGFIAGTIGPVFGYTALAAFIVFQLILTVSIVALLTLSLKTLDDAILKRFSNDQLIGDFIMKATGFSKQTVRQIGILVSGSIRLLVIIAGVTLILGPWGFRSQDLLSLLQQLFSGISIGGYTFSLATLLGAILVFVLVLAVARIFRHWLEDRFLPETKIDAGLKTSIQTATGYLGIVIAFLLAVSYAGLSLSNIAIVAGALSVGIGFGLQSIVNNFVSGLILLAERPVKVGDWIVVGSEQGNVKRINVRSTEIETFDSATVIVPNSDLISGVVTNWMHDDQIGRIIVQIGVGYDSDPDEVKRILLDCTKIHPMILKSPAPAVYLVDFGASSLDFQLRCHLQPVDYMLVVKSALRFEILKRFREAGIEIPFHQTDINLRDIDRLVARRGE